MTPAQKRGGLHQADLGGEGGARTTGEQQGGDHRTQLTEQGEGNQRPQALLCAEILQYVVTLQGEHHADEEAGHQYDGDGLHSHHIQLLHQQREVLAWLGSSCQCMKQHDGCPADGVDETHTAAAQLAYLTCQHHRSCSRSPAGK